MAPPPSVFRPPIIAMTINAAIKANVTINPIDARGLVARELPAELLLHPGALREEDDAARVPVEAVNDAPVASADALSTAEDTPRTGNVLANDSDPDGGVLNVTAVEGNSADVGNTIALANELIEYLNAHPEIVPIDTTLYIIRNMNPDGEARAHSVDGRVNNSGVDLNRNFPANWRV